MGTRSTCAIREVARVGPSRLEITELPVGVCWTLQYKEELEQMMIGGRDHRTLRTKAHMRELVLW